MIRPEPVVGASLVIPLCGPHGDPPWAVKAFADLYPYAVAIAYQRAAKLGDKEKGVTPAK